MRLYYQINDSPLEFVMKKIRLPFLALGTMMILAGCGSDYFSTELEEPANNLPFSQPMPIAVGDSDGYNGGSHLVYPRGVDYPN